MRRTSLSCVGMEYMQSLAAEARELREEQGVSQAEIAAVAGVAVTTISRFERGLQPERLCHIVAAYEDCVGLEPFELWARAAWRAKRGG